VNARLQAQIIPGTTNHYADQFAINPAWNALILCSFFTLPLAGTAIVLRRKDTR
jgi:hypothetical protein